MNKLIISYLIAAFGLALLSSCGIEKNETIPKSSSFVIKVNPDEAESVSMSKFVTEDRKIKLNLPSEIIIGSLRGIKVDEGLIYVFSSNSGGDKPSITVFDDIGEFQFRVANWGRGPGEFEGIYSFAFTNEAIVISTFRNLSYYDKKSGEYLKTIAFNNDVGILNWIGGINDSLLVHHDERTRHNTDKTYLKLININKNERITEAGNFQNHALKIAHNHRYFYRYNDTLSFIPSYEPTVFRLGFDYKNSKLTMSPAFTFDFGDKWIPESYLANTYNNREEIFSKPSFYIHTVVVYETDNTILATYNYRGDKYALIYDRASSETKNLKFVEEDSDCEIRATYNNRFLFSCEEGKRENLRYFLELKSFK